MEVVLIVLLAAFAVAVVVAPLRQCPRRTREDADRAELDGLLAASDAKYREIREAELDYRTGKLAEPDWRSQDRALRGEAVDILRRIDELEDAEPLP